MAYKRLSPLDGRSQERWRGMAFGQIQSGPYVGRVVSVVEFSETGCRIRDHGMKCEVGAVFHMTLEDVGPMIIGVRWCNGAFIGIEFRHPLSRIVLDHLHQTIAQPLQQRMTQMMANRPSQNASDKPA
ncbi:hypothetical protein [Croceicoccus naphthovorans]|uniref:hypothetical protein n=1 Tax=Croceicoccus naphthovorans TaxID=1348774 RepID=UPI0012E0A3C6|nr:hypothetical protein [Croceicoccus naphthovorans]MBB3989104.1 hypothetical protein [Croceicoccus naphthovorans]